MLIALWTTDRITPAITPCNWQIHANKLFYEGFHVYIWAKRCVESVNITAKDMIYTVLNYVCNLQKDVKIGKVSFTVKRSVLPC